MPTLIWPENSNSPANSSPPRTPTPLQVVTGDFDQNSPYDDHREMRITPTTSSTSFELPEGWLVHSRPRGPNSSIQTPDKYYYEPGTRRMFRSLVSVKRYLNGEEKTLPREKQGNCLVRPYKKSGTLRRAVNDGKLRTPEELEEAHNREPNKNKIVPTTLQPKSSPLLPDGWFVEKITRGCGIKSDRYFVEPGTGKKFRSKRELQEYLEEGIKHKSTRRALTISNYATAPQNPAPHRKNMPIQMLRDEFIDLTNPPEKINWVFSGDSRDSWSPVVEECVIPSNVKEQWTETFLLGMNGWKQRVPQLIMAENNQASNA